MPVDAPLPWWRRRPALIVAALTLVALVLDLVGQGLRPIWLDEAASYWTSRNAIGALLHGVGTDGTPPGYFLILHFAEALGASGELGLRVPSLIAGVALVPAAFVVMRRWTSVRAALAAAALVTISPLVHDYAVEARNYAVVQLESVGLLYAFVRASDAPERLGWWIWTAVAEAVLVFTHVYGVFLLPAPIIASLVIGTAETRVRRLALTTAAAVVAVVVNLPWLRMAMAHAGPGVGDWIRPFWLALPPWTAVLRSIQVFGFGAHFPPYLPDLAPASSAPAVSTAVTAGLVAAAFVSMRRWRSERSAAANAALLVMVVVPLLCAWICSMVVQPIYLPGRYDTIVLPAFLMLLALGLDRLAAFRTWAAATAVVVVLALASLSWATILGPLEDVNPLGHRAGEELTRRASPGDRVVALGLRQAVTAYYATRGGFQGTIESFPSDVTGHPGWYSAELLRREPARLTEEGAAVAASLIASAREGRGVWVLAQQPNDIDRALWVPLMSALEIDDAASDPRVLLLRVRAHPAR